MIIQYRDKSEIDTSLLKEKLELISKSPTENASYLSKILLKALAFLFPKIELNTESLQEYSSQIAETVDALVVFSNEKMPEIKTNKPVVIVGNTKTNLKNKDVMFVHLKDDRKLLKVLQKYAKVAIGFNPNDIAFSKYYDTKMRIYFWNVLDTLDKMTISLIEKDVEKACTYLLLDRSRFEMHLPDEKEKISLKKMIKVYQKIMEHFPEYKFAEDKFMFYTQTEKTTANIMMLNEMSVLAELYAMPNEEERISKIYDIMCERMLTEAHELGYCQFENNRCIASRYTDGFPNSKENGCCQNTYKDRDKNCRFLQSDYSCKICSISCRFFACAYLQKRGIDHALYRYPLIDVTFGKFRKAEIVHDFFTPKEEMMKRLK